MAQLITIGVLLAGIVILTPLADRIRVPQPVLLTVFGLAVPLIPGTPALPVSPEVILPVVLPPLLFAATQRTTLREFRDSARPVLLLAVGLTTATAAVIAVVAHVAGLGWGPACVLGAIVSPPDPVAATAVARRLRLPPGLVTVLEGEGMFNDATALVLYKVAVIATVTGGISTGGVVGELIAAIGVGVLLGIVLGWLTKRALRVLHHPTSETTLIAVMPFAAYLLADELHGSGVLAVLAFGLFLRTYGHSAITSSGYLLGRSVWRYADFIITSLVFTLIGFELTALLEHTDVPATSLRFAALIVATVVVFRVVWMYPAAWAARYRSRRRDSPSPYGWRQTTVAAWAGMRGVVTVATALALPTTLANGTAFPERDILILTALLCVLVTLIGQGLTLAPVVALLKVGGDSNVQAEVATLRREATGKALDALRGYRQRSDDPVLDAVVKQYEGYLAAQLALQSVLFDEPVGEDEQRDFREILQFAAEVERDIVLRARRSGRVSPAAADRVMDDVETRAARGLE